MRLLVCLIMGAVLLACSSARGRSSGPAAAPAEPAPVAEPTPASGADSLTSAGEDDPSAADDGQASSPAALSATLAERLASWEEGLVHDDQGELQSLFGFPLDQTREILYPIGRERALPRDYTPPDLARAPGARSAQLVRAVITPDLAELEAAARRSGIDVAVVSGFRSYASQAALFDQRVQSRLAAARWTISVDEARTQANGGTALPGHSQHQLGTAVDVSAPEVGYQVTPAFARTAASLWLQDHAWEYGFVLPYTERGRDRTGYISEPWHLRWIGRPLAAFLMSDGYLDAEEVVADDYLEALDSLVDAAG